MKKLFPILIFILTFIVYAMTGYQDLTFTDNGELAASAVTLGISHPTGYPLFIILSHIWSIIPLGLTKIHQLNLFSALFASLSSVVVYFTTALILKNKSKIEELKLELVAMKFALIYSLGNLIWQQSNSLEVYSLHFFFLNLMIFLSFKLYFNFDIKILLTLFFTLGLSFTNHLTTILIVPSLLFLLIFDNKFKFRKLDKKVYLYGFSLFLIALSIYAYLPIRSSMDPLFNWGGVSRSFDKFLYHVQGKQYQVWMFTGSEAIKENLAKLPEIIFNQFQLLILMIIPGLYFAFKKSKYMFVFLMLATLVTIFYSSNYIIHDIEPYFGLMVIGLLYFGVYGFLLTYEKYKSKAYLLSFMLIPLIVFNFPKNDYSEKDIVPQFTTQLIDNLDSNAVVISAQWDFWVSAFWYKQQIEGYRKDVILIEKELLRRTWYPKQVFKWYPELESSKTEKDNFLFHLEKFEKEEEYDVSGIQVTFIKLLKSFIDKNIDSRPVYLTYDILQTEQQLTKDYFLKPEGLAFRVYRLDNPLHETKFEKINIDAFLKNKAKNNNHLDAGIFEFLSATYINYSRFYMGKGNLVSANKCIDIALKIEPENVMALQMKAQIR